MGFFKEKGKDKPVVQDELPIEDEAPAPPPVRAVPPVSSGYGIEQAIQLMRSLPSDLQTTDIVVQVIKRTLESAQINVGAIIQDASRKEERIETRIRTLQEEIAMHEKEIATRRSEIERMQTDLEETSKVKERLVMAEQLTNAGQ
ncbi:MAG TPA: hypothetical protein VGQ83_19645 [Polyangia bacterium]|jgi:hypothetical protein